MFSFSRFPKNFFYRKKIQLQLSKSGIFVVKKCSLNSLKFYSLVPKKKHFWYQPFYEKLFLSEKNPTSSFKIGGKKIKIPPGSSHFFLKKKSKSHHLAATFLGKKIKSQQVEGTFFKPRAKRSAPGQSCTFCA